MRYLALVSNLPTTNREGRKGRREGGGCDECVGVPREKPTAKCPRELPALSDSLIDLYSPFNKS